MSGGGSAKKPTIDIEICHRGILSLKEKSEVGDAVARMFRCDENLSEFYRLCKRKGGLWLNAIDGLGRLLRSPTVFEDVVKTICTTNIQWGGTKRMAAELVLAFGEPYPLDGTLRAFPTPEAIAEVPWKRFLKTVRLGYRSLFIHTLAQRVSSGDVDLEALHESELSTSELKKRLLSIKGVGDYAAANLLMLLGRYDELAVDTVFRQFVHNKYFQGRHPPDREAAAIYDPWGRWKYLAYWLDITFGFQGEY
jgi:3-methyladenine DNA glycosylase/8-oxoguanine DNA glycosylase